MTDGLRQDNIDRAKADLKPEGMKSTGEQIGDSLAKGADGLASFIPGQEKTRDHFTDNAKTPNLTHDHGRSGGLEAFKPAGEQTTGEYLKEKADQAASYVQPDKSKTQEATDTITPGHHSDTKDEGKGLLDQVGEAVVGAKDAIANALGGTGSGNTTAGAGPRNDL